MAAIANTFRTYDAVGRREDLSDVIYNISPEETVVMSAIGKSTAKSTLFEWQTDALGAANSANAQPEGDDFTTFQAAAPTVRLQNHTQISKKDAIVSGTQEEVDKAGRDSEMAYQMSLRSAELKIDMESIITANQGASAGTSGAPTRLTAGLGAFVKTNTDKATAGTAGVDPVYTSLPSVARTDGTTRAITETMVKSVLQKLWTSGAKAKLLFVGAVTKQTISTFTGLATRTLNLSQPQVTAVVASVDVYVGDFGTVRVIPSRYQRSRDAWFIDPEFVSIAYLRKFRSIDLARTGDNWKKAILVEYGLKVNTEKALGGIFDLL
jgi:hypothetical protein